MVCDPRRRTHAGNLLRDLDGGHICDVYSVAIGLPEWDLVPAANGTVRFGEDHRKYEAFADAHGLDVTVCPAWSALRRSRELQLLTSLVGNLVGPPRRCQRTGPRATHRPGRRPVQVWHRCR